MAKIAQWGTHKIPYTHWDFGYFDQESTGLRTGPEGQRDALRGLVMAEISTLTGGLTRKSGIHSWLSSLDKVAYSEGLQHHIPGILCHPYALTTQATLIAADFSGYRAANKRVHAINCHLGASGMRFYPGIGPYLLRNTSTSNPALALADTLTDDITAMALMELNNTEHFTVAGGATDDIKGTTDPTASPPTWVTLVPLIAGDRVDAMFSLPHIAGGVNLFSGKINGYQGLQWNRHRDALQTLPSPLDVTSGSATPAATLNALYAIAGAGADDASVGTLAWTNPGNITLTDGVFATLTGSNADGHYLRASSFGFAVPTTAAVVGAEVGVVAKSTSTTSTPWQSVRLFNASGAPDGADKSADVKMTTDLRTWWFGGNSDVWGMPLTPTIVNDTDFGVGVSLRGGTSETVSVDSIFMTVYYREGATVYSITKAAGRDGQASGPTAADNIPWGVAGRLAASDASKNTATWTDTALADTNKLLVWNLGVGIPETATIRGIVVQVERSESNAAADATDVNVSLMKDFDTTGSDNKADTSTEWPTADGSVYYGAPDDLWGLTWTPAQINSGGFGLSFVGQLSANTIDLDYVAVTVYYQLPQTALTLPLGGFSPGRMPSNPNRIPLVAPRTDEASTVNVPRQLWYCDLTYDATNDRLEGELSLPNTGLNHIEDCKNGLGGSVIIGDNSSGIATSLKLVRSDDQVQDLRLITSYNGASWGCTGIKVSGRVILLTMAKTDGTEAQTWGWFDGELYASFLLQSKSNAIASLPLATAEDDIDAGQRQIYHYFPISTTNLAAARQFMPRDWFADPLSVNTSEAKYLGALYIQGPELNIAGAVETNKTLNQICYDNRQISAAGGAYASVQVQVDTGGDTTFASAEANTGAMTTAFKEYDVPSSGIAYKTLIHRITMDNTGDATKTGNGLPIRFVTTVSRRKMKAVTVYIDDKELQAGNNVVKWLDAIDATSNTKNTQRLHLGPLDIPATLETPSFRLTASDAGQPSLLQLDKNGQPTRATLTFLQKPGKTTA